MKYNASPKKPKIPINQASVAVSNVVFNQSLVNNSNQVLGDNIRQLERCWSDYLAMEDLRERYRINRDFRFGKQGDEKIYDEIEQDMPTKREYMRRRGRNLVTNNFLASIEKNIKGQFRKNPPKPIVSSRAQEGKMEAEMVANALQAVHEANQGVEMNAQALATFLLSGAPCRKIKWVYDHTQHRNVIQYDNVNINKMFFNTDVTDIRMKDIRRIGEFYDIYIDDVLSLFAKTKEDEENIKQIYSTAANLPGYWNNINFLSNIQYDNLSFFYPTLVNKCRVFEIWEIKSDWRLRCVHDPLDPESYGAYPMSEKKKLDAENKQRAEKGKAAGMTDDEIKENLITWEEKRDQFWSYKIMAPTGHVLAEGETFYEHASHPYVLTLHPLIDGEVRGWMEDLIDIQRQIDKMFNMIDGVILTSSKNTLLVPETAIPKNSSPEQFADDWAQLGGVIVYTPKAGSPAPQSVSGASIPAGISEMLNLEMKALQQISGIQGPIMGQQAPAGTPAALYEQEAANASLNTIDIMQVFANFLCQCDLKTVKLIKQYYTQDQFIATAGKDFTDEAKIFKAEQVQNFDYNIVMSHGFDSPTYRQAMESQLSQFVMDKLIPIEAYLQVTDMPYAEKIMQAIDKLKQQAQQVQQGGQGGIPAQVIQAAQQGNPQAQQLIQQAQGQAVQGQPQPPATQTQ
jgi:hypothetical protein